MATCVLNDTNEKTEKNVHLVITTLCDRNCKYCCNRFYSMDEIPTVTDAELKKAENVYLTGGEPFAYGNPIAIAKYLKTHYPNIQKVVVYTNAVELYDWIKNFAEAPNGWDYIDGLNISVKNKFDAVRLGLLLERPMVNAKTDNRVYIFKETIRYFVDKEWEELQKLPYMFVREWQKEFVPSDDSIFRRMSTTLS